MNPGEDEETDDAALFRAVVGPVKPLPASGRIAPAPAAPKPRRRTTQKSSAVADTLSDFGADSNATEYLANGLSRQTLRKLRRNFWPVADRIDLHGLNSDDARRLLQHFLLQAARHGMRCVLVIHGKGMNSPDAQGKLRVLSRHWLTQHPQVLAWCEAPLQLGGSGAVLALLKIPEKI
ncbi:MAG: Smr/MutS family protein [Gallionella sp.]|nr:Smr/MutS family protein [Gallionella sp.]